MMSKSTRNDNVYLYTIWNSQRQPLISGLKIGETIKICRFFVKGHGITVHEIWENTKVFRKIISNAIANGTNVITCNFKRHLDYFELPVERGYDYPVYDLLWRSDTQSNEVGAMQQEVQHTLMKMSEAKLSRWQRIAANAAVVYKSLQDVGVTVAGLPAEVIWLQETYSGRSKNLGLNLQNHDDSVEIMNGFGSHEDIFLHFDWLAADIRVAAYLSGDELLNDSFQKSDPYEVMESLFDDGESSPGRSTCKTMMLKSINSFDYHSPVMADIFPGLGRWLAAAKQRLDNAGWLETVLGRRFSLAGAKNERAVLNGVFQGSVVHGLQLTIKRIWDKYGNRLMAEMHDSVVMTHQYPSHDAEKRQLAATIKDVVGMMAMPFSGILDANPFFPVKVSIGRRWRQWQPTKIYRENGAEPVNEAKARSLGAQEEAPGQEDGREAEAQAAAVGDDRGQADGQRT